MNKTKKSIKKDSKEPKSSVKTQGQARNMAKTQKTVVDATYQKNTQLIKKLQSKLTRALPHPPEGSRPQKKPPETPAKLIRRPDTNTFLQAQTVNSLLKQKLSYFQHGFYSDFGILDRSRNPCFAKKSNKSMSLFIVKKVNENHFNKRTRRRFDRVSHGALGKGEKSGQNGQKSEKGGNRVRKGGKSLSGFVGLGRGGDGAKRSVFVKGGGFKFLKVKDVCLGKGGGAGADGAVSSKVGLVTGLSYKEQGERMHRSYQKGSTKGLKGAKRGLTGLENFGSETDKTGAKIAEYDKWIELETSPSSKRALEAKNVLKNSKSVKQKIGVFQPHGGHLAHRGFSMGRKDNQVLIARPRPDDKHQKNDKFFVRRKFVHHREKALNGFSGEPGFLRDPKPVVSKDLVKNIIKKLTDKSIQENSLLSSSGMGKEPSNLLTDAEKSKEGLRQVKAALNDPNPPKFYSSKKGDFEGNERARMYSSYSHKAGVDPRAQNGGDLGVLGLKKLKNRQNFLASKTDFAAQSSEQEGSLEVYDRFKRSKSGFISRKNYPKSNMPKIPKKASNAKKASLVSFTQDADGNHMLNCKKTDSKTRKKTQKIYRMRSSIMTKNKPITGIKTIPRPPNDPQASALHLKKSKSEVKRRINAQKSNNDLKACKAVAGPKIKNNGGNTTKTTTKTAYRRYKRDFRHQGAKRSKLATGKNQAESSENGVSVGLGGSKVIQVQHLVENSSLFVTQNQNPSKIANRRKKRFQALQKRSEGGIVVEEDGVMNNLRLWRDCEVGNAQKPTKVIFQENFDKPTLPPKKIKKAKNDVSLGAMMVLDAKKFDKYLTKSKKNQLKAVTKNRQKTGQSAVKIHQGGYSRRNPRLRVNSAAPKLPENHIPKNNALDLYRMKYTKSSALNAAGKHYHRRTWRRCLRKVNSGQKKHPKSGLLRTPQTDLGDSFDLLEAPQHPVWGSLSGLEASNGPRNVRKAGNRYGWESGVEDFYHIKTLKLDVGEDEDYTCDAFLEYTGELEVKPTV